MSEFERCCDCDEPTDRSSEGYRRLERLIDELEEKLLEGT